MKVSRIILSVTALFLLRAADVDAATLYERSLKKFQAATETVSPDDYSFVVLGDSRGNDAIFQKALALARGYNPLFLLHGGDYSDNGSDKETDRFLAQIDAAVPDLPFFVVMGNHENRKVFTKRVGPLNFSIESARLKLKLISVDNSGYALKPAELTYLAGQLASRRENTFVAMHIPPKTERWTWHTFTSGSDRLLDLLAENRVNAAFYFHIHLYARDEIRGIPSIISAGAGAPLVPFGFPGEPVYHIVLVRVKNGAVTTEMVKI